MIFHRYRFRTYVNRSSGMLMLASSLLMVVPACSTFEETGGAQRAKDPAPDVHPSQRDLLVAAVDSNALRTGGPGQARRPVSRPRPKVTRGQDTVKVSTSRSRRSTAQRSPLVKPPNAMYTVQIGAFQRATHALAMLKQLKEIHNDQPVFNNYSATDKMYRISVGKFETLREASNYRKTLMKGDKPLYNACWVTYIQR